jgi:hypothetical protein
LHYVDDARNCIPLTKDFEESVLRAADSPCTFVEFTDRKVSVGNIYPLLPAYRRKACCDEEWDSCIIRNYPLIERMNRIG